MASVFEHLYKSLNHYDLLLLNFQCVVLFSIPWSIGAVVDFDGRHKFDVFYKDLLAGKFEESPIPKVINKFDVPIPPEQLVYDVYFEVKFCCNILFGILV